MAEFLSRKNWGLRPLRDREGTPRKTYAQRADDLAKAIGQIRLSNHDPFSFHTARDEAERAALSLARSLGADGL